MKTNFTPGPWSRFTNPITDKSTIGNEGGINAPFATVNNTSDAALIAAAPDLYRELYELVETVKGLEGLSDFGSFDAENDFEISKAEEALKKATNQS